MSIVPATTDTDDATVVIDEVTADDLTWQSIVEQHAGRVYRLAYHLTGNKHDAEDLTQDVFVRVSKATIPAASDGEVRAWLFTIARNLAIDHNREHLRRPEPSVLTDEAVRAPSQDVDLAVNEALAALGDLDRDVFLMREVAGLGF